MYLSTSLSVYDQLNLLLICLSNWECRLHSMLYYLFFPILPLMWTLPTSPLFSSSLFLFAPAPLGAEAAKLHLAKEVRERKTCRNYHLFTPLSSILFPIITSLHSLPFFIPTTLPSSHSFTLSPFLPSFLSLPCAFPLPHFIPFPFPLFFTVHYDVFWHRSKEQHNDI